jgi:release factor glutamine methyltransferase
MGTKIRKNLLHDGFTMSQVQKFYFRGFEFNVFPGVYEPREDSFVLADAVTKLKAKTVLDMGCGTGIIGIAAALCGAKVWFVDVDERAVENAKKNTSIAGIKHATFVKSDLFERIGAARFELIAFNPPYIECAIHENVAVCGGLKGREVLDRFLAEMEHYLTPGGRVLFLQSTLNGVGKTERILQEHGFAWAIVSRLPLFFEELLVFECWPATPSRSARPVGKN